MEKGQMKKKTRNPVRAPDKESKAHGTFGLSVM